jgi:hypothetical protein
MGIFKRNRNILTEGNGYEITSGIEFILKRALNNGINNIFIDGKLTENLPEIDRTSSLRIQPDTDFLWTEIYSLAITNRRAMAFAFDQSFLKFLKFRKIFYRQ